MDKQLKIIEPCKNTLLGYAQAARQHGKLQEIVRLERLPEQTANQRSHFPVVSMLKSLVQRHVVFIDQENDLLTIMFFEKAGELFLTSYDICFFVFSIQNLLKILLLVSSQLIAGGKKPEA